MYEKTFSEVKRNDLKLEIRKEQILLLIDCDPSHDEGVSSFIKENVESIDRILYVQSYIPVISLKHQIFWTNERGMYPDVGTEIVYKDFKDGFWKPRDNVKRILESEGGALNEYLDFYFSKMKKIKIRTWPKMCPVIPDEIEKAIFRQVIHHCMPHIYFTLSWHPLTDYKTLFTPEVERGKSGGFICPRNDELLEVLREYNTITVDGGDLAKATCAELKELGVTAKMRGDNVFCSQ